MSYKIDMTSPDVDKQIELLKFYPEVMEKHFKPVLIVDVSKLYSSIKGTIPKRTGRAISKFKKSVTGKGINLTGRVGWWGSNQPWYINIVEYGAKSHPLNKGANVRTKKKSAIFQRYMSDPNRIRVGGTHVNVNGRWVTMQVHPGFSKRGFMSEGFTTWKPEIDADMARASEAVVKEMAVP